ncbi:hypothetical protein AMTR_s00011p00257210 [Amborella trichopoda]|uniref:Uncharacterized protein n=1 Tax=Amborella trichopoda TaxID=13333 RepID=W1NHT4_AMBTC|nr:hypothetical protein AMTR_s00011p00257210 [Amborella trichopoda]
MLDHNSDLAALGQPEGHCIRIAPVHTERRVQRKGCRDYRDILKPMQVMASGEDAFLHVGHQWKIDDRKVVIVKSAKEDLKGHIFP